MAAALEYFKSYFYPGGALARVLAEAPYLTHCSDNKTAEKFRPREYAIRLPYMQLNRSDMVSWLIFDLDHTDAWGCWEDNGLPPPNLIVRNRENRHSQLFYAIHPVCTSENARPGPIAYMKAIYNAFVITLRADTCHRRGAISKTPGHPWWETHELHSHVYHLAELAETVELESTPPWRTTVKLEDVEHSRHCMLFEMLRHYAYAIVNQERATGNFERFSRKLEAHASANNRFAEMGYSDGDLPYSSIRSTVRSVARWTWDKYNGNANCQRGIMQLDHDTPLPERQKQAAARTHSERTKATENKLQGICRELLASGKALTQVAVAAAAKLSRQTIAKYKHVLEATLVRQPPQVKEAVTAPTIQKTDVKFAVHQVTGGQVPKSVVSLALIQTGRIPAAVGAPDG